METKERDGELVVDRVSAAALDASTPLRVPTSKPDQLRRVVGA